MKKTVLNSAVGLILGALAFQPCAEAVRVLELLEEYDCPRLPSLYDREATRLTRGRTRLGL